MGMIACYQIVDEEIVRNLFNKSSEEVFEIIEELQEDAEVLDIDKMWDGLHFLLTNVTASEPIVGSALSEAIVGSERFCDEEDADFIRSFHFRDLHEKKNGMCRCQGSDY